MRLKFGGQIQNVPPRAKITRLKFGGEAFKKKMAGRIQAARRAGDFQNAAAHCLIFARTLVHTFGSSSQLSSLPSAHSQIAPSPSPAPPPLCASAIDAPFFILHTIWRWNSHMKWSGLRNQSCASHLPTETAVEGAEAPIQRGALRSGGGAVPAWPLWFHRTY